ncbi:MAG: formate dehydrogenase subunit gamma [Rhizobacter sp.]|nr:formate dehydrogenase subunit gamma [Rhizobacter sp.]
MRLTLRTPALAALVAVASAVAFAQQGTADVPRDGAQSAAPQPPPAPPAKVEIVPNDAGPTIVLPPGSSATITTTPLLEPQPGDTNAQRARSQPLNNAPFWRGVHDSGRAPGTVNNMQVGERGELIQPITSYPGTRVTTAGEAWRQLRNWWIVPFGGALVLIVVLALALYYWAKGPIGRNDPHTGRKIERFTYFERAAHWVNAIAFCILAISGLVMAFGKFLLLPLLGGALFGWLTWLLKTMHNFVGPLFSVSLVIVFLTFLRSNWPTRADWDWLRRGGGMFGRGGEPPSHRFNAGEKLVFWGGVVVLGIVLVASGFILDKVVPGVEMTRSGMQVAHIVHAVGAMLIIAVFLGHIYMGTIGMRGAYRAMKTGYVDEGWAREHHRLWYDDIAAGRIPAERAAAVRPGREQPAA